VSQLRPGDRVRLLALTSKSPSPVPEGTLGTVVSTVSGGNGEIEVRWDMGGTIWLVPVFDSVEVIGHTDLVTPALGCPQCGNLAMDLLHWTEDFESVTCALCGFHYEP
jgi:hypothetical protein